MDQAQAIVAIPEILTNFLLPILTGLIFAIVTTGLGSIIARFIIRTGRLPLVESFALGCLFLSLITMLFGTFGLLTPTWRLGIALVLTIISIFGWLKNGPFCVIQKTSINDPTVLTLGLLLIVGVVLRIFFYPLFPPVAWDTCSYHLPNVVKILETGRDTFYPEILYSNAPHATEMLFFWACAWSPLSSAQYVNFLAYLALLIVIVRLGTFFFSEKIGWLAALLFATLGHIQSVAAQAYNDLWIVFYELLATLLIAEGLKESNRSKILLAGLLIGAASATKYTSLVTSFALILSIIVIHLLKSRDMKPVPLKTWAFALLLGFIVAAPWYIRSLIWFQNPVYPFMTDIFPPHGGPFAYYADECAIDPRYMLEQYTIGTRLHRGVILWHLYKQWSLWTSLPLCLILWKRSPFFKLGALWSIFGSLYWLIYSGGIIDGRYYLHLAGISLIALSYLISNLYSGLQNRRHGPALRTILWIALIIWVGLFGVKVNKGSPPLIDEKRAEYTAEFRNSYNLIMAANEVIPDDSVAVGMNCEDGRLFADFTLYGGTDVGWANHGAIDEHTGSAEEFARFLADRYNAGYIVVNETRLNDPDDKSAVKVQIPYDDPRFEIYFTELARSDDGPVYRINPPPDGD